MGKFGKRIETNEATTRIALKVTGETLPFTEVETGNAFFKHGKFWMKINHKAAAELAASGDFASICNFTIDECDRIVGEVIIELI